jgi:hypothetical protein
VNCCLLNCKQCNIFIWITNWFYAFSKSNFNDVFPFLFIIVCQTGPKCKQPLLWAWTRMCCRVGWAATHNVRHWAVRLHEAAVLLASVRPARLPSYPVAVEFSSADLIHRSGSFPRCTVGILSHLTALQLGFYFIWFTHLTAPLDLPSLLLVVVALFLYSSPLQPQPQQISSEP